MSNILFLDFQDIIGMVYDSSHSESESDPKKVGDTNSEFRVNLHTCSKIAELMFASSDEA